MKREPSQDDLEEVRRAAFELRERNPSEAVRVLRKLAKNGGEIEPLVHGALGEILLEDFDDVDGSLHHFRRLLELAPGVPAGELGLARALGQNSNAIPAQEAYLRALAGFDAIVSSARSMPDIDAAAGLDEAVLTLLEIAVEERRMCDDLGKIVPRTQPSAELLDWAESTRLFDDDDAPDDVDDWIRFAGLRIELAVLNNDRLAGAAHLDRLAKFVPFDAEVQADLLSLLSEGLVSLGRSKGRS